jgi:hypothetical protein
MMINEHLSASPTQPYQGGDDKTSAAVTRNTLTPAKYESIEEYGQQVKRAGSKAFEKPKKSVS